MPRSAAAVLAVSPGRPRRRGGRLGTRAPLLRLGTRAPLLRRGTRALLLRPRLCLLRRCRLDRPALQQHHEGVGVPARWSAAAVVVGPWRQPHRLPALPPQLVELAEERGGRATLTWVAPLLDELPDGVLPHSRATPFRPPPHHLPPEAPAPHPQAGAVVSAHPPAGAGA